MYFIFHHQSVLYLGVGSGKVGDIALTREAVWESLGIFAIVIGHVIVPHPFHLAFASDIELFPDPWVADGVSKARFWFTRRCSVRPSTGIDVEVPKRSNEGCFCPICLNSSTTCCPVISFPKTGVNPHWLVLREWNANGF